MKKEKFFTILKCSLFGIASLLSVWNIIKMLFDKFDKNFMIQNFIVIAFFGYCLFYTIKEYKKKKEAFKNLEQEEIEEYDDEEE